MIYIFGDCTLDTCLYTLERGGQTIRLRPKVFRVSLYLLEHRERVVTREELCAQVWPGQFISQATLEGVIRSVRQAVGDSGQAQGIIQTLHGYGYRFVARVEERPSPGLERVVAPAMSRHPPVEKVVASRPNGMSAVATAVSTLEALPEPLDDGQERDGVLGRNGHDAEAANVPGGPVPQTSPWRRPQLWRRPRLSFLVGLGLAILLVAWGVWWMWHQAGAVGFDRSRVAVLPFVNLSPEADLAYFTEGMTEELIAQLSQIRGLTVIARTSVMKYRGTLQDIATIGRELRVGTILEGSVRQVGTQVRISAQLIDVASQGHLWSQEYDRELTGVFGIQSDIATRVAQRLKVQLSAGERRRIGEQGTGNLEAYTWYLQGRYFRNQWSEAGLQQAIGAFEQAIQRDPHYALAYAGIADAYLLLPFVAATTRPLDVYPRAIAAVEQALQYGESFAAVQTALASAKLWYAWDWAAAESAFKQALALSPNDATAHRRYAWYLIARGRLREAIAVIHRAQELNPLSPALSKNVGLVFYFARQYDQAISQLRHALDMDGNLRGAYSGLVYAYAQQGRHDEALIAAEEMLRRWGHDPGVLWDFGYATAVSGQRDRAREALAELRQRGEQTYVKPLALAWIALGLGDKEASLTGLEQAFAEHDPYLTLLAADPVYDPVRAEPRFTALLQKVGLNP